MIKPYHLLICIATGAILAYFLIPRDVNDKTITNRIDSLRSVVRWKEIREKKYDDSLKTINKTIALAKEDVKRSNKAVSLAEAGIEQWRQRYYALKKIVPMTARDSLKDLVATGNACDSLVQELGTLAERRREQVLAINGELTATVAKVKAMDTVNLLLSSENRDLKQMDSLHVKNERILKKKANRAFLKGGAIGTAIGIIVAALLI